MYLWTRPYLRVDQALSSTTHALVHKNSRPIISHMSDAFVCPIGTPLYGLFTTHPEMCLHPVCNGNNLSILVWWLSAPPSPQVVLYCACLPRPHPRWCFTVRVCPAPQVVLHCACLPHPHPRYLCLTSLHCPGPSLRLARPVRCQQLHERPCARCRRRPPVMRPSAICSPVAPRPRVTWSDFRPLATAGPGMPSTSLRWVRCGGSW